MLIGKGVLKTGKGAKVQVRMKISFYFNALRRFVNTASIRGIDRKKRIISWFFVQFVNVNGGGGSLCEWGSLAEPGIGRSVNEAKNALFYGAIR
jgi:hypothetical protein